jgi:hypothetical protein
MSIWVSFSRWYCKRRRSDLPPQIPAVREQFGTYTTEHAGSKRTLTCYLAACNAAEDFELEAILKISVPATSIARRSQLDAAAPLRTRRPPRLADFSFCVAAQFDRCPVPSKWLFSSARCFRWNDGAHLIKVGFWSLHGDLPALSHSLLRRHIPGSRESIGRISTNIQHLTNRIFCSPEDTRHFDSDIPPEVCPMSTPFVHFFDDVACFSRLHQPTVHHQTRQKIPYSNIRFTVLKF